MNNNLLPWDETPQDNSLIEQAIGVAKITMDHPLTNIAKRMAALNIMNSTQGQFQITYNVDDYKARNTILASPEAFENHLKELDKISPNGYSLSNPNFDKITKMPAFILFRKMTMELALRDGKGGHITVKRIHQYENGLNNENAEEIVGIYANYFNKALGQTNDEVIAFYSGGKHIGFASTRTIICPIKGLGEDILYDWKYENLTLTEQKQYISWLNQLLSLNAADFLHNLIRAIKVSLEIDPEEPSDQTITFESRDKMQVPSGMECIHGVFNKVCTSYDLTKVKMTDNLACIPVTNSFKSIDDKETVKSRFGDSTVLSFEISSQIDELEKERYECMIPVTAEGIQYLERQGFAITDGSVQVENDSLLVRINLKHEVLGTECSIEHLYKGDHIKIIQAFPHLVVKNWLSKEVCGGKTQIDIYSYNSIPDQPCYPKLNNVYYITHEKDIRIVCQKGDMSKIPERYYRPSRVSGKSGSNTAEYFLYCMNSMPNELSFVYAEGGKDVELGCLLTRYRSSIRGSNKTAYIGIDLGTCNTVVAVRDSITGEIKIVDVVKPASFHSISYIPENLKVQLETFYRLSIGYDENEKKKIRTAVLMYSPDAEMNGNVHKEGSLFLLNGTTMNMLASLSNEENYSYVETDIKFGGRQRPETMKAFLRELVYLIISEQIAEGASVIEFNVSYPNEGLKDVISGTWTSLIAEITRWPMVANNKIKIMYHNMWTEAAAVANHTLNQPAVLAAAHIGFANVDIGDGTTDISIFTPFSGGTKFAFSDQVSIKYAADDIFVDTIVYMFAKQKNVLDRYKALYGQPDGTDFAQIWLGDDNDGNRKENIARAESLLDAVDSRTELYRHDDNHEKLRNEILTLVDEYGIDATRLSSQFKALLTLRYATLFYTVACHLKKIIEKGSIIGSYPIYLYGGGSKGLSLLMDPGRNLSNSAVGMLFRNMIAAKLQCNPVYIELEFKGSHDKTEVALGMVEPLHSQLSNIVVEQKETTGTTIWDDDSEETDDSQIDSAFTTTENRSLKTKLLSVAEETVEINDKLMKDFIRTLHMADMTVSANDILLKQDSDGWLYTVLQSARLHMRKVPPKDSKHVLYVSEAENARILSNLNAQRNRDYGNTHEIPQQTRIAYQAARMVDQYLIKVSSKTCQE